MTLNAKLYMYIYIYVLKIVRDEKYLYNTGSFKIWSKARFQLASPRSSQDHHGRTDLQLRWQVASFDFAYSYIDALASVAQLVLALALAGTMLC